MPFSFRAIGSRCSQEVAKIQNSESKNQIRTAVLLVNTHSRRGKELFDSAEQTLQDLGVKVERAVKCETFDKLLAEAKKEIQRKGPLIVAGGGDGTFHAISNIIAGTDTVLGLLPLGTGNAFARDLGIRAELHHACEVIATGRVERVDAGVVNGSIFLNVATIGLTREIARSLQESFKRRFGRFVYIYAVFRALEQIRPFKATLETENGKIEFETLQVVIGNGRYHAGPFKLAPDAGVTTGKLSLYALESASKASLLKLALHLPSGTQGALPEVHSESTTGGVLTTFPAATSIVDGEVGPMTPLKFSVNPHCIKVMVPSDFGG